MLLTAAEKLQAIIEEIHSPVRGAAVVEESIDASECIPETQEVVSQEEVVVQHVHSSCT